MCRSHRPPDMTTASRPSREALGLQLSELSNAVDAETDLDYAYRLQLEEALEASLRSQPGHEHLAPHLPPAEEQPSQTARALQLQVPRPACAQVDVPLCS